MALFFVSDLGALKYRYRDMSALKQVDLHGKGATIRFPGGGGQEYLSRANYLFQPGSAARWKFHISLHVYMEHFLM